MICVKRKSAKALFFILQYILLFVGFILQNEMFACLFELKSTFFKIKYTKCLEK